MRVSPRALSPFTRFEPMNPAAPVTTVYTLTPRKMPETGALKFDIDFTDVRADAPYSRCHGTQQLIAHRARRGSDIVHRQALPPQDHRAAYHRLRHVGQVDRHHIHRNAPGGAHFLAADQYGRAVGGVPRIAVSVTTRNHANAMRTRCRIAATVTDAGVGFQILDRDQLAAQGHDWREAERLRGVVWKWR